MKKHTLSFVFLLGLTPCYTQPYGKFKQLCKKMIAYTKKNVFNSNKKRWIGVTAATGTTIWCYKIYNDYQNRTLIRQKIDECISLTQHYQDESSILLMTQARFAVANDPQYATKYLLENFDKTMNTIWGSHVISIVLHYDPSALNSINEKMAKYGGKVEITIDSTDLYE